MKKDYVKPTIESEEFVANEYVAACWTVACKECLAFQEGYDDLKNRVESGTFLVKTMDVYTDTLGGADPCQTYDIPKKQPSIREDFIGWLLWEIFVKGLGVAPGNDGSVSYHPVSVIQGWENHPNASV